MHVLWSDTSTAVLIPWLYGLSNDKLSMWRIRITCNITIGYRKCHCLKISCCNLVELFCIFKFLLIQLGLTAKKLKLLRVILCSIRDFYLVTNARKMGQGYESIYNFFVKIPWQHLGLEKWFIYTNNDIVKNVAPQLKGIFSYVFWQYSPMYSAKLTCTQIH